MKFFLRLHFFGHHAFVAGHSGAGQGRGYSGGSVGGNGLDGIDGGRFRLARQGLPSFRELVLLLLTALTFLRFAVDGLRLRDLSKPSTSMRIT